MPDKDVIELLSSDDDTVSKACLTTGRNASTVTTAPNQSLYLQNDFDSTVHLEDDREAVRTKRRKINHAESFDIRSSPPTRKDVSIAAMIDDQWTNVDDDDPVVFISSTNQDPVISRSSHRNGTSRQVPHHDSENSLPEDPLQAFPLCKAAKLSERTAALLASLGDENTRSRLTNGRETSGYKARRKNKPVSRTWNDGSQSSGEEIENTAEAKTTKAKKAKLTDEERQTKQHAKEKDKDARARQRELSKKEKAKEKDEEKERRRIEREERAKQKRADAQIAEVNRSKIDKKDSTPEMVIDLPASLNGCAIHTYVKEYMKNLNVDVTLYQSPVPNVIKWRRKMKAKWNVDAEHWEPLEHMVIENEKHVLCYMPAKDFAALAMAQAREEDIELHVSKLKTAYDDCIPLYLIEGMQNLINKSKTAANRAYQAKVLAQDQPEQAPPKHRRKPENMSVDEDAIDDALLRLQVTHGCLVHQVPEAKLSADWIMHFTQHISTIPYRQQKMNLDTTFSMDSGQVKTGEDKDDTFFKMLQEVVRVTPPIAQGIAGAYPSTVTLVKGFREKGPLMLEHLQKAANRNGAVTDRKIGPAISRRLYKVFLEQDPMSTDV